MKGTKALASLAIGLLLAGCALVPAADPPMTASLLDQVPADVPRRAATGATLLVLPPLARPAIDSTQMAYTLRPHHLAYFAQNQWAETPPQMLQPLLVRTLEATGAFRAVLTTSPTGSDTLALQTEIVDLVQDFSSEPPVLRFSLRARLANDSRALATKEITVRETMQQKTPYAGVVAANAAVAQALRQLAGFVLENVR